MAIVRLGSPAARAGLQKNDVIARFGGEEIISAAQLLRELWRHKVGENVGVIL